MIAGYLVHTENFYGDAPVDFFEEKTGNPPAIMRLTSCLKDILQTDKNTGGMGPMIRGIWAVESERLDLRLLGVELVYLGKTPEMEDVFEKYGLRIGGDEFATFEIRYSAKEY